MSELTDHVFDTLVIGGGPGGLTAAIYLRRFTRNVVVVDKGNSRLCLIPVSHNYPGFPEGVPGSQLLNNLTNQLKNYDGSVLSGEITALRLEDGIFIGDYLDDEGNTRQIRALTVLMATGVADAGLPIENFREAVQAGAVRLCPVCDGYDVRDKRIAVVTSDTNPVGHALFMRSFSADVTLFDRSEEPMLDEEQRRQIEVAGVRYIESPLRGVTMSPDMKPILNTADGESREFDVFYPMLGESARSKLACELGAETGDCDKLIVDDHQRTTVPGLYAIGDVVQGLNQIAVAAGQAAIAATTIHNALPWALRPKVEVQRAA
ncbi:MAG: NAD(P)/FAD-dependent oxidoreductase [Massilia sp.]|nr:NAD(P)/FAD-dependent oxidoreductase [Massilia sp.]